MAGVVCLRAWEVISLISTAAAAMGTSSRSSVCALSHCRRTWAGIAHVSTPGLFLQDLGPVLRLAVLQQALALTSSLSDQDMDS